MNLKRSKYPTKNNFVNMDEKKSKFNIYIINYSYPVNNKTFSA